MDGRATLADAATSAMRASESPETPKKHSAHRNYPQLDTDQRNPEAFLDDQTPLDDDDDYDDSRDSHDLSPVPTWNSVVDNLLLSFDQLPNGGTAYPTPVIYSRYDDDGDDIFSSSHNPPRTPRNHNYNNSYSSDFDLHPDGPILSHHSSQQFRNYIELATRRAGLGMDDVGYGGTESGRYSSDTQRGPTTKGTDSRRWQHSRATTKESIGSTGSSFDYSYRDKLAATNWGFIGRAASFDQGQDDKWVRNGPQKMASHSALDALHSPTAVPYTDAIDSAPTPAVPQGPRRTYDAFTTFSYPPSPRHSAIEVAPPPRRKNSLSSRLSRKSKSNGEHASARRHADDMHSSASSAHDRSPFAYDGAADPFSPVAQSYVPTPTTSQGPKEKPSFFRRVFGSSKQQSAPQNIHSPVTESNPPKSAKSQSSVPSRPRTTQGDTRHIATQLKEVPPRSGSEGTAAASDGNSQHPPTLAKKPSSIFRRRKKSVSELHHAAIPPVPPLVHMNSNPKIPSPMYPKKRQSRDSLRKVMDPYLQDRFSPREARFDRPQRQTASTNEKRPEKALEVRPEVPPKERIHDKENIQSGPPSRGRTAEPSAPLDAANASHPSSRDPKFKVKKRRGTSPKQRFDDTFLADSSGNSTPISTSKTFDPSPGTSQSSIPATQPSETVSAEDRSKQHLHVRANVGEKRTQPPNPESSRHRRTRSPAEERSAPADEGVALETISKKEVPHRSSGRTKRIWLEPDDSDEKLDESASISLPIEGHVANKSAEPSPSTPSEAFHSASSLPIVQVGDNGDSKGDDDAENNSHEPRAEDRERALQIFKGDEDFVTKKRAAAWLGEASAASSRTRKAYMELFEWTGFSILLALRDLCGRLIFQAESQQLDRVLDAFSNRWVECNPTHGFKATDVVHTISYSLLLLNTDLHMADMDQKMTREQFVRNTMPTIRRVVTDAVPDTLEEPGRSVSRQSRSRSINLGVEPQSPGPESPTFPPENTSERPSLEMQRPRNRFSMRIGTDSDGHLPKMDADNCHVLVRAPFDGPMKGWESQIEVVLKEFYRSIKQVRLPLHGAEAAQDSSNNLAVVPTSLRRSPSALSKAASESISYRGRPDFRSVAGRWTSRGRNRPRIYPASTYGSSRTSLDEPSVWSPTASSTWSKYSLGKSQTSMSIESLGSHFFAGDHQKSIGFANALSQAIFRQDGLPPTTSWSDTDRVAPLLDDETLELAGPPWAKEGMLKHKQHFEAPGKKVKDRNWNECFAVVEKGYMRLFSFDSKSSSRSFRGKKGRLPSTAVVGGGNWTESAEETGSFILRQTLATALPPPGYSKSRPHVWALSLPTGAVHFFQANTPEIVQEFITSANYWAARLSKEPLIGGVSNIEYGWSETVLASAFQLLRSQTDDTSSQVTITSPGLQSSIQNPNSRPRTSTDTVTTIKSKMPGDRAHIVDWTPPNQSMMASQLMEVDQLKQLSNYVKNIQEDFAKHTELRGAIGITYTPRTANANKALANWQKKSDYLLREIVKFEKYVDALKEAQQRKEQIYEERSAEHDNLAAEVKARKQDEDDASSTIAIRDTTNTTERPETSRGKEVDYGR